MTAPGVSGTPIADDSVRAIADAVDEARHRGLRALGEPEALRIAAALGIGCPRYEIVTDAAALARLEPFAGDRVVVKAILPDGAHKTDVGGVRVVPGDFDSIAAAVRAMEVTGCDRFMVAEHIAHDLTPGGELLLGMRWTEAFGAIVTFGAGGTFTELLATALPPAVFSPLLSGPGDIEAALRSTPVAALLTDGFRGAPPIVAGEVLERLAAAALVLAGRIMPGLVSEFEINPLVFTPRGPLALDAKAKLASTPALAAPPRPAGLVQRLLHPETIAVVGVSQRMNVGRLILRNIVGAGFSRDRITVVKQGIDEIDGCGCVPDLSSLPGRVDLLVVAVAAEEAAAVVEQALAGRHASSIILVAGGAGERPGTERIARRIAGSAVESRSAGDRGFVVNGPNSLGVRSRPGRYDTFFIPSHKMSTCPTVDAPLAIVSQSGAYMLSRLDRIDWLRPMYAISVGNQIDVTIGDYIDHFSRSPEVRVVACYLEGFRPGDGKRFVTGVRRIVAGGGAVVLYPAGRTPAGADAAASHTASVAGDHTVTVALARQAGALVVNSIEAFEDQLTLAVLLEDKPVAGRRLGALSNAGFETVAFADNAALLDLVTLDPSTVETLRQVLAAVGLGGLVTITNPLDLTPAAGDEAFAAAVAALLDDPGVDVGVVGCVPFTPALQTLSASGAHDEDVADPSGLVGRLTALGQPKPWVAVVDGGVAYAAMTSLLTGAGIPVFPTADRAVRALGAYVSWQLGVRRRSDRSAAQGE